MVDCVGNWHGAEGCGRLCGFRGRSSLMVEMKAAHSMSVFGVSSFVAILFIWGVWIDMSSCSYVLWFVYSRATPRYKLVEKDLIIPGRLDTLTD